MPAPKMYTKAQWDEFIRLLDALPEKPPSEQRITVRDAMPNVRVHIDSARAKGYSVEQLIEQAKQAGIDVTASALRYALQEAKKRRATGRRLDGTSATSGRTNTSRNPSSKRATGQQTSLTPPAKTERDNTKSNSMGIQDTFGFKIRPDIEDI
jgi:post-segregation antitoxin (ccd killing protein)